MTPKTPLTAEEKLAAVQTWVMNTCHPEAKWDDNYGQWYTSDGDGGFMHVPCGLAEVLRAWGKRNETGSTYYLTSENIRIDDLHWSLEADLAHQSEKTIDFLFSLIQS